MMTVTTLDVLNEESFCESVLSCVKLVVSDIHESLKTEEIRMLVMFWMNHEFMEYMSGGLDSLEEDEEGEEFVFWMRNKIMRLIFV